MTKPFTSNSTSLGDRTMDEIYACVPIRRGGSRILKKAGRGGEKGWVREALSVAV